MQTRFRKKSKKKNPLNLLIWLALLGVVVYLIASMEKILDLVFKNNG